MPGTRSQSLTELPTVIPSCHMTVYSESWMIWIYSCRYDYRTCLYNGPTIEVVHSGQSDRRLLDMLLNYVSGLIHTGRRSFFRIWILVGRFLNRQFLTIFQLSETVCGAHYVCRIVCVSTRLQKTRVSSSWSVSGTCMSNIDTVSVRCVGTREESLTHTL
jgi:hypothetical protein